MMTEEQFIKDRVDDQIQWYGKKSAINKRYHLQTNSMIIICAAMVPFFSGLTGLVGNWSQYVTGVLGVITASLTGIVSLAKFQEKWATYRLAREALEREKILYNTVSEPYQSAKDPFHLFVLNVERIMKSENTQWEGLVSESNNSP